MTASQIFVLMLIGHFFADFNLQGLLKELKQKSWWKRVIDETRLAPSRAKRYRHDYIAALACHGLYWAAIVCLPFFNHPHLLSMVLSGAIIHAVIDHLKCNCFKINLIEDQILHLGQILGILIYGTVISPV